MKKTIQLPKQQQRGVAIVEFVVVAIPLFMLMLGIVQFSFMSHAKSQVYYATYEAARAASAYDPKKDSQYNALYNAFERGMVGYYGGGSTQGEIDKARSALQSDIGNAVIITYKNIDDKFVTVKTTFGIPENKQIFFINKIILEGLRQFGISGDAATMVSRGRIPVSAEVTMHLSPVNMETPTWKKDLPQNGDLDEPGAPGGWGPPEIELPEFEGWTPPTPEF